MSDLKKHLCNPIWFGPKKGGPDFGLGLARCPRLANPLGAFDDAADRPADEADEAVGQDEPADAADGDAA